MTSRRGPDWWSSRARFWPAGRTLPTAGLKWLWLCIDFDVSATVADCARSTVIVVCLSVCLLLLFFLAFLLSFSMNKVEYIFAMCYLAAAATAAAAKTITVITTSVVGSRDFYRRDSRPSASERCRVNFTWPEYFCTEFYSTYCSYNVFMLH